MKETMNRRSFLRAAAVALGGSALAACQPSVVEVEKEVTRIVEEIVKEEVIVEGTPQVVEKVVEKVITAQPAERGPVTLRWGSWAVGSEAFEALANEFEERYPHVTIQQEAAPCSDPQKLDTKRPIIRG